ncbi:MAG TPA: glucose-1-phosphate adenylyltransferase [Anaerolineaceae bacterium]
MASLDSVLAVILGGGRGARLFPLTKQRSKPAVPIAGKYRLIDIPISNCINSGIYRINVLTQFNSVSLNRHITRTYNFDHFHPGWVQILAAEQTIDFNDWYQGSADAIRKQLFEIKVSRATHVLILAGDHLYRMDYAKMFEQHIASQANITVGVTPVAFQDAGRFGILKSDSSHRIIEFAEKPKDPAYQRSLISIDNPEKPLLGSMGIYLFDMETLSEMIQGTAYDDFGSQVIPAALKTHRVFGYQFDGYWEDIGTIRTFYETNLALTSPNPPFDFFDQERPIYTNSRYLPGTIVENSHLENVLMAEGCCIRNAEIRRSVIGLRSQVRCGVKIIDSVVMGADYYENPCWQDCDDHDDKAQIGIGANSHIEGAIIDKNARVGKNVVIRPFPRGTEIDRNDWSVKDGIVVVPKNGVIPSGTIIAP